MVCRASCAANRQRGRGALRVAAIRPHGAHAPDVAVDTQFLEQVNRRVAAFYALLLCTSVLSGAAAAWSAYASDAANAIVIVFAGVAGWVLTTAFLRALLVRPLVKREADALRAHATATATDLDVLRSAADEASLTFVVDALDRYPGALEAPAGDE